ncbi:hypothetical protein D1822_10815 [Phaeobacter inhibens]|uniref:Uncharacterized protein n=1 Tax=Phaeobacter inhibens TaxID=221822 RepID=A0A135IMH3_9RHOB|nr:hypothetical protein [Phaeobacter inhibens]AFO91912.1 hypothetical protein PGA1_c22260 [Phaeobacter inhibens DSM 17395]AUQ46581.1 hypothetical protein PhaeoP10_02251 [Phaeobacter inhibens]AUQ98112.1 hypothetical protein PhaeoP88_00716 [Phaeobacter inhibens]AXT23273.1 hypothetical protein D1822_10815 [Phaeobacter inhibens]KXF91521.1 hypothetical protein AT574_06255 [Phaeobacter inhibens]
MKLELFQSALAGALGVMSAILTSYGTSWPVVVVVCLGVAAALLEIENLRWRPALVLSVFNLMIGALGGPMVAAFLGSKFDLQFPALTLIIAFLVAYVAHDAFSKARGPIMALMVKVIGMAGGSSR